MKKKNSGSLSQLSCMYQNFDVVLFIKDFCQKSFGDILSSFDFVACMLFSLTLLQKY